MYSKTQRVAFLKVSTNKRVPKSICVLGGILTDLFHLLGQATCSQLLNDCNELLDKLRAKAVDED